MPVVVLVSAALAGVLYLSLGQVLEASARDIASAEAQELREDLRFHTIEDLAVTHDVVVGTRVSQVVDDSGRVVVSTGRAVNGPLADPVIAPGGMRVDVVEEIPGLGGGGYAVAVADGPGVDGRRYSSLVAVPTQVETTAFARSLELAVIGAVGLVALLAAVTTFAVGQALRPVERMRDQVEDIAASRPAPTLEVPAGRDELAKLAETMNHVLERLRRADSARRAFVADAGHELRSPLSTIRVLLDRLAEDRSASERRVMAERASAEVDRLAILVDDLLELASADERALRLTPGDVDLDDVVLAEAASVRARGMPVAVTVEPTRVVGDAHRLGRVVRNLLDNAERHRESGGPRHAGARRRRGGARGRQRRSSGRPRGARADLRAVRSPRRLQDARHRWHRAGARDRCRDRPRAPGHGRCRGQPRRVVPLPRQAPPGSTTGLRR